MPEKICNKCSEQANIAYLFKNLCESSDTTLRELSKQFDYHRELFIEINKENVIPEEISLGERDLVSKNGSVGKFYHRITMSQSILKDYIYWYDKIQTIFFVFFDNCYK